MKWSICGKSEFPALVDFALEKEWEHTFFTARLIEKNEFRLPPKNRFPVFILHERNTIKAACMVTSWGGLFPIFRSIDPPDGNELKVLQSKLKANLRRVYSIMGIEERVELLKPLFNKEREIPVRYKLMVKKGATPGFISPPSGNFTIHKAVPDDSAALLALELDYQEEEVFINPDQIDNSRIYHNLRQTLQDQIVYFVTENHIPVAKAGTNARGHLWNQIGGVFTDYSYRNRGISTWLLDFSIKELESEGKKTVLFVKEANGAAEKVYNKLGFVFVKNFNITYYS